MLFSRLVRRLRKLFRRDAQLHRPDSHLSRGGATALHPDAQQIAPELRAICGEQYVSDNAQALAEFAIDGVIPSVVVSPGSPEEVSAVARFAAGSGFTVTAAGGFTQQHMGELPERIDILLRTSRLNNARYDAGTQHVRAQAGCTLAALNAQLAADGMFFPVDAMLPESATIGGALATAASGPLLHNFGSIRDLCVQIEFVAGDGRLITTEPDAIFKDEKLNMTAAELRELMIGSLGTLGIIVSADFRVFPLPGATRTLLMDFDDLAQAAAGCDQLRNSSPSLLCLEIVSWRAREYLWKGEMPVRDPDDYAPEQPVSLETSWRLLLRAPDQQDLLDSVRQQLKNQPVQELHGEAEAEIWRRLQNFQPAVAQRHRNVMFVRMEVPAESIIDALLAAEQAALDNSLLTAVIGRIAKGSLLLAFIPLAVGPPSAMHYATAVSALRSHLPASASVIVTRCPTEAKTHFSMWGSPPSKLDRLGFSDAKRTLDPKNIFNRGRYLA
jgi:glycolate oxidase FAD binding subunit